MSVSILNHFLYYPSLYTRIYEVIWYFSKLPETGGAGRGGGHLCIDRTNAMPRDAGKQRHCPGPWDHSVLWPCYVAVAWEHSQRALFWACGNQLASLLDFKFLPGAWFVSLGFRSIRSIYVDVTADVIALWKCGKHIFHALAQMFIVVKVRDSLLRRFSF